ncbi:hypothetical protein QE327_gp031 [Pseudomonas phage Henu5]|uniref:Uncharacterized protein n=1 Tax=Pseudomonas phage Henu5 TaxID=2499902 RepID=A0A410T7W6_9CAUD|nr:hypothetical protein QE327_gp031 [Pseudomonas phage Henu5]QAU05064.1 hypothetical protein Henu5_gp33 [Pseudomonas phage Henu5]
MPPSYALRVLHQIGAATIHVRPVFPFVIFLDRKITVQVYRNAINLAAIVSRVECPMITKRFHNYVSFVTAPGVSLCLRAILQEWPKVSTSFSQLFSFFTQTSLPGVSGRPRTCFLAMLVRLKPK